MSGSWDTWLFNAGRGSGKTRSAAEFIRENVEAGHMGRVALVAPTAADARDVMVEGQSGILAIAPPWFRPIYNPSKRLITWPNGARAMTFSAEEPDRLRGPQHDGAWGDEVSSWQYEDALDNLIFGLRLGDNPRKVFTTTPKPNAITRRIMAEPGTIITTASTYDNRANLAKSFLRQIAERYEGTRLGQQEIHAKLLTDIVGALWSSKVLDDNRVRVAPEFSRVVVAVDPAATSHAESAETGIMVGGRGMADQHGYVLEDASFRGTPGDWGRKVVLLYDKYHADCVVAEVNNGGEMVKSVIDTAAAQLNREGVRESATVNYRAVTASRGKIARAEPVSALYEQGRVHHVGNLVKLEEQMLTYEPSKIDRMKSPDRLDAAVWLLHELMLSKRSGRVAVAW